MKTLLLTLILSAFAFAGCTTKNNSMSTAPGADLAAQNGGVQTTGSAAPAGSATPTAADATPTPSAQ